MESKTELRVEFNNIFLFLNLNNLIDVIIISKKPKLDLKINLLIHLLMGNTLFRVNFS